MQFHSHRLQKLTMIGAAAAVTITMGATSAFAAVSTPTKQPHWGMAGGGLMGETSTLLKLSPTTLMNDLRSGKSVAQVAQAQNVSPQTLTQELAQWLTQQQNTSISKYVNQVFPAHPGSPMTKAGAGQRPGGKGRHGMAAGGLLGEAATLLKLSPSTLMTDLRSGKSVAQVAQAQSTVLSTLSQQLNQWLATQQSTTVSHFLSQTFHAPSSNSQPKPHAGMGAFGPWGPGMIGGGLSKETATLLKLSPTTLMTDLRSGKSVAQIAQAQNVSPQTLTQELEQWAAQQQSTSISHFVNQVFAAHSGGTQAGPGSGQEPNGKGRHGMAAGGLLGEAATLLKLSPSTLMSDLRSGKSVSQVAQAQNVNTQTLSQQLNQWLATQQSTAVSHFLSQTWKSPLPHSSAASSSGANTSA